MGGEGIVASGTNFLLTGCRIQDCDGDCVSLGGNWFMLSDNFISNSTAQDGLQITGTIGGVVVGNYISNHALNGIRMTSASQNMIGQNYIFSNGDAGSNGNGISLSAGNDNCIVGNVLHTNDGVGLVIVATSNKNIVVGNTVLNNEDGAITDGGTGTLLSGLNVVA
jgi:parallel beta-helix repeat protein